MAKIAVKIVLPNTATCGSGGMVDARMFNFKLAEVIVADANSTQPLPITQAEYNKLA
jgi:hypothetical protein